MTWDKQVLVHMDDAMRVPKASGLFNTVAHHFYEVSCILYPFALQSLQCRNRRHAARSASVNWQLW